MKRLFHLMIVALAAVALFSGCEKYDDTELKKEIQDLREKLSSLEAWCSGSQSAIDAVAVLQEAVKNMNSVESVEPFIDADGATGYVITFTNKQTIKLYNGKDGDTFFGNVVVNDDCIIFTLADGRTFTVPRKEDEHNYLYFEAVEDGATVSIDTLGNFEALPSIEYSTNGQNWTAFDFSNPQTVTLAKAGDKVFWRNTGKASFFSSTRDNRCIDLVFFELGDKKLAVGGNIMSLIDKSCQSLTIPCDYCFSGLFSNCASLVSASGLKLPATGLTESCYSRMFLECTSLESAPELPAKELAQYCYTAMFGLCTSLESAPELPATKLAKSCYSTMFAECTSLVAAPDLPVTELAESCYDSMFAGCTSLEAAPELPATELAEKCYFSMFTGCTSLEVAPELPATKLVRWCYLGMFAECENLKHIKVGFEGWGSDESSATSIWLWGVSSEGMFECPEGLEIKYGEDFIPEGWSVNGATPVSTNNFAAPATKSISDSKLKSLASKAPEIRERLVEHDMITL